MRFSFTGVLLALGAAVTWGLVYAIDQRLLQRTSPILLLVINSVISSFLLSPVLLARKGALEPLHFLTPRTSVFLVAAIVLGAVANLLIYSSITTIGAPLASVLEIAYPFFVVTFDFLLFHERPTSSLILGGTLIFVGAAIIVARRG